MMKFLRRAHKHVMKHVKKHTFHYTMGTAIFGILLSAFGFSLFNGGFVAFGQAAPTTQTFINNSNVTLSSSNARIGGVQSPIDLAPGQSVTNLNLDPATYTFYEQGCIGGFCQSMQYTVNVDGSISIPSEVDNVADLSDGGHTLTWQGQEILVDNLTDLTLGWRNEGFNSNPNSSNTSIKLFPGSHQLYAVGYIGAEGGRVIFSVQNDTLGTILLDATYSSFTEAVGNKFIINGFPILVTNISDGQISFRNEGFGIQGNGGNMTVDLIPGTTRINGDSNQLPSPNYVDITIDSNGQVTYDQSVSFISGYGTSSITIGTQTQPSCASGANADPDLISWWKANGTACDSEDGNHGTENGGVTYAAGNDGQAFLFDGIDDYVATPSVSSSQNESFSASLWFYQTANASNYNGLLSHVAYIGSFPGWYIGAGSPSMPNRVYVYTNILNGEFAGANYLYATQNTVLNSWNHVEVTYDGSNQTLSLYLNGELQGTQTGRGYSAVDRPYTIGRSYHDVADYQFAGMIDDVKISTVPPTAPTTVDAIFSTVSVNGAWDSPTATVTQLAGGLVSGFFDWVPSGYSMTVDIGSTVLSSAVWGGLEGSRCRVFFYNIQPGKIYRVNPNTCESATLDNSGIDSDKALFQTVFVPFELTHATVSVEGDWRTGIATYLPDSQVSGYFPWTQPPVVSTVAAGGNQLIAGLYNGNDTSATIGRTFFVTEPNMTYRLNAATAERWSFSSPGVNRLEVVFVPIPTISNLCGKILENGGIINGYPALPTSEISYSNGTYTLLKNLNCSEYQGIPLRISSNVTLDGGNHTITGHISYPTTQMSSVSTTTFKNATLGGGYVAVLVGGNTSNVILTNLIGNGSNGIAFEQDGAHINAVVTNNTMNGPGAGYTNGYQLYSINGLTARNNIARNHSNAGMYFYNITGNLIIENNSAYANSYGVLFNAVHGVSINQNSFNFNSGSNYYGHLRFINSNNIMVDGVNFGDGGVGVSVEGTSSGVIIKNSIFYAGSAIAFDSAGTYNNVSILNNIGIGGSAGYAHGLALFSVNNAIVSGNSLTGYSPTGVYVYNSSGVILTNNTLQQDYYGLYLGQSITNVNVYHNNIYGNYGSNVFSNQAYEVRNHVTKEGNYWGGSACSSSIGANREDIKDDYQYLTLNGWLDGDNDGQPDGMMCSPTPATTGCVAVPSSGVPIDLSIQGEGFFQIQLDNGETVYTRTTVLHLNQNGMLVDSNNNALSPIIFVPSIYTSISVTPHGEINVTYSDGTINQIGTIAIATFPQPENLEVLESGYLRPTPSSGDPITGLPGEAGLGLIQQTILPTESIEETDNPLDAYIYGRGFYQVELPDGSRAYTRGKNGFVIDSNGFFTIDGNVLTPQIMIPLEATNIIIAPDGTVSFTIGETITVAGQIQLALFTNEFGLNEIGPDLFVPTFESGQPLMGRPGTSGKGSLIQVKNVCVIMDPRVTTLDPSNVTPTTATFNAILDDLAGNTNITVGFQRGTDSVANITANTKFLSSMMNLPGAFSLNFPDPTLGTPELIPGTTYYYQAIAQDSDGTLFAGSPINFVTSSCEKKSKISWFQDIIQPTDWQYSSPQFMVADGGNAYVMLAGADVNWHQVYKIQKYDSAGTILWSQDIIQPTDWSYLYPQFMVAEGGNTYVMLIGNDASGHSFYRIQKYDANGTALWFQDITQPTDWSYFYPQFMVADGGNTYVMLIGYDASGQQPFYRIQKYDADGTALWFQDITQPIDWSWFNPQLMVADGGNAYVMLGGADLNGLPTYRIQKYDSAGAALWFQDITQPTDWSYFYPQFMVADGGDTYVMLAGADVNGQPIYRIQKYDSAGAALWFQDITQPTDWSYFAPQSMDAKANNTYVMLVGYDASGQSFSRIQKYQEYQTCGADSAPPIITLYGTTPVHIEYPSTYTEAGATAIDDVDGDISDNIVIGGTVNTNALGTYTLTYNVSDAAGNAAEEVTRTVIVEDTTAPVITRLGEPSVTVIQGQTYTDAGATVSDNYDTDLVVATASNVNTSVVGTYTVRYNVTDTHGNIAEEVTRTVIVEEIPCIDTDDDGYGISGSSLGCVYTDVDCDDSNAAINPGATEMCDNIDNNCNNQTDEGFNVGQSCISQANSCNDINHGVYECTTNGLASQCNVTTPLERPNYGQSCTSSSNNCEETNPGEYNICLLDGTVGCDAVQPDDKPTVIKYKDGDGDGYGNELIDVTCSVPSGVTLVDNNLDCNDNNAAINPAATDLCDGVDNNCNGTIDDSATADQGCAQSNGWVKTGAVYSVNTGACDVERRQRREYRVYYCGIGGSCAYNVSQYGYTVVEYIDNDQDNDGICNVNDRCANTNIPEAVPSQYLKPNNYAVNTLGQWIWNAGTASSPVYRLASFSLADTYGCTCEQILYCKPGADEGELKRGCTGGPNGVAGNGTVGIFKDKKAWASKCFDPTRQIIQGESKPIFENTDDDLRWDLLDGNVDGDEYINSEDLLIDDANNDNIPDRWFERYMVVNP